jgi:hypothetical protein
VTSEATRLRRARYMRSAKGKAAASRYRRSAKGKAANARYRRSEKGRATEAKARARRKERSADAPSPEVRFARWRPHPGWSAEIPLAGASIIGVDGGEGTWQPLSVVPLRREPASAF